MATTSNPQESVTPETTAARVRAARAFADLEQRDLAEALELSVATIRRIERGGRTASAPELIHIGEVCGVPREFMLHGFTLGAPLATPGSGGLDLDADMARLNRRDDELERRIAVQESFMERMRALINIENDIELSGP